MTKQTRPLFKTGPIEDARKLHGLTKGELSRRIGINANTYTRFLKGEVQHPPTVKRLADYLKVPMEDLR